MARPLPAPALSPHHAMPSDAARDPLADPYARKDPAHAHLPAPAP
ncbi:hypothetical protein [Kitasatospora sp. NPDC057015]